MIGNKADLVNKEIDEKEGLMFAEKNDLHYFEASARSGKGINELFEEVGR